MSDEYQIKDLSSLHKYRTELPNIIFELGLTADHIGVYSLLKRIAGDSGSCFSSNTKLGEKLKMTAKTFANFKDDLEKPFDMLGGLSLIESQERNTPEKGRQSDLVTITDIWPINMQFMANLYKTPPLVKITEGPTSKLPTSLVKITEEEEPIKKTFIKETTTPTPSKSEPKSNVASAVVVFDFLKGIGLSDDEMNLLNREYQNDRSSLEHGVKYATHKDTRVKTTLIQTIRWAAKQKPDIPKQQTDNKQIAEKYKSIAACPSGVSFEVFSEYIEISYNGGSSGSYTPFTLAYSENGFEEQLKNALRKYKIGDKTKPINTEMKDKLDDLLGKP